MNKRLAWIDNLKGVGIILVILGHMLPGNILASFIYSFHMPMFFFISGYLNKNRDIISTIDVKTRSLLKPYLIAATWSFPIGFVMAKAFGQDMSLVAHVKQFFYFNGDIGWNTPLWFLIVLFFVETFSSLTSRYNLYLMSLIFFTIGFLIFENNIILPFGIHIVFFVLPFYLIGMIVKKENLVNKIELSISTRFFISISIMLFVIFILKQESFYISEIYHSQLGNFPLYYLKAILMIFSMILLFCKTRTSSFLNLFSKNTLFILTTHYLFFYGFLVVNKFILINKLFYRKTIPAIIMTVIVVAIYYVYFKFKNTKQLD